MSLFSNNTLSSFTQPLSQPQSQFINNSNLFTPSQNSQPFSLAHSVQNTPFNNTNINSAFNNTNSAFNNTNSAFNNTKSAFNINTNSAFNNNTVFNNNNSAFNTPFPTSSTQTPAFGTGFFNTNNADSVNQQNANPSLLNSAQIPVFNLNTALPPSTTINPSFLNLATPSFKPIEPSSSVSILTFQTSNFDLDNPLKILENIQLSYDTKSPYCKFKHVFYNVLNDLGDISKYTKPPHIEDSLWTQAVVDNPDPKRMAPVIAFGFDDLNARIELQNSRCQLYKEKSEELDERLETLLKQQNLVTLLKLKAIKKSHDNFSSKLLKIIKSIELIRKRGQGLSRFEDKYRHQIESLYKIKSEEGFKEKLLEFTEKIKTLNKFNYLEKLHLLENKNTLIPSSSSSIKDSLFSILNDQKTGLSILVDAINKDFDTVKSLETNLISSSSNKYSIL